MELQSTMLTADYWEANSHNRKMKLYKKLIRPATAKGREIWTLAKEEQDTLRRSERQIVRRVFGRVKEDDEQKMSNNQEIDELLKHEDIQRFVKFQ